MPDLAGIAPILGVIAGIYGCAFAFAPVLQIRKMMATGGADQVSLGMFLGGVLNGVLWLAYGVAVGSLPVVASNMLGLATTIATLVVMLRLRGRCAEPVAG